MVILDKDLKFVKRFKAKDKDKEKLKEGERFEVDYSVPFVFCDGEKILCMGHYSEKFVQEMLDKGYEMYDRESFEWMDGEPRHLLYNDNGKKAFKTPAMLLVDAKERKKQEALMLEEDEQTRLILNANGEKENLEAILQEIDGAETIEELEEINIGNIL